MSGQNAFREDTEQSDDERGDELRGGENEVSYNMLAGQFCKNLSRLIQRVYRSIVTPQKMLPGREFSIRILSKNPDSMWVELWTTVPLQVVHKVRRKRLPFLPQRRRLKRSRHPLRVPVLLQRSQDLLELSSTLVLNTRSRVMPRHQSSKLPPCFLTVLTNRLEKRCNWRYSADRAGCRISREKATS